MFTSIFPCCNLCIYMCGRTDFAREHGRPAWLIETSLYLNLRYIRSFSVSRLQLVPHRFFDQRLLYPSILGPIAWVVYHHKAHWGCVTSDLPSVDVVSKVYFATHCSSNASVARLFWVVFFSFNATKDHLVKYTFNLINWTLLLCIYYLSK